MKIGPSKKVRILLTFTYSKSELNRCTKKINNWFKKLFQKFFWINHTFEKELLHIKKHGRIFARIDERNLFKKIMKVTFGTSYFQELKNRHFLWKNWSSKKHFESLSSQSDCVSNCEFPSVEFWFKVAIFTKVPNILKSSLITFWNNFSTLWEVI